MNEEIILNMAQPYVKDGAITYDEFDAIYSMLSRKEQYAVVEIFIKNGIDLIDKHVDENAVVLDVDEADVSVDENEFSDDLWEPLYDESIFQDHDIPESGFDNLVVYDVVKQSNEILCSLVQQGNRQAIQDLCIKNRRLVAKYAAAYEKKFGSRLDYEDLEQVGFMGLIKAAQKFDIKQGTSFSTYAVYWIKQSIAREIMDNGFAIRIPVHMMERINKVNEIDNRLYSKGVSSSERVSQIAEELDLTEDMVRDCFFLRDNYLAYSSLNAPIGDDGDSELGDFIPGEGADDTEEVVLKKTLREEMFSLLDNLKERERDVILLRFGLIDGKPRTLEEIGTLFNVTRERIRQIEAKALRKLRNPYRSNKVRDYLED